MTHMAIWKVDRFFKGYGRTMQEGIEASDFAFRLSGDEFILGFPE